MADPNPIRTARQAKGMTQSDLAKRAGMSRTQITQAESGSRPATVATLYKVAMALELDDLAASLRPYSGVRD